MSENATSPRDNIEAMFVQSAHGMTAHDHTLTLHGLAHATLFFADRPERVAGHIYSKEFIDHWSDGEDSFAADPPNAVLAFLQDGDATPEDVTMILRDPKLREDTLSYRYEVLDGHLPVSAGPCSLFIDPIGRPLSPGSVAGVRRRQRRRMSR